MVKKVTNRVSFLFGVSLIFLLCVVALFPMKAKGGSLPKLTSNINEWIYYKNPNPDNSYRNFGECYEEELPADTMHRFDFKYDKTDGNKHYLFKIETYNSEIGEFSLVDYNKEATQFGWNFQMNNKQDFKCHYDKKNQIYTYSFSGVTDKYVRLLLFNYSNKKIKYNITVFVEPEITLAKTAISEITNTKQRTMTVKYAPVKKRLGYQIEYSTDNKFKDKQRVNTGATTKDVGKLTKGKTYYVRVRTYARYNDGTLVYSKWSGTKKIKIKK